MAKKKTSFALIKAAFPTDQDFGVKKIGVGSAEVSFQGDHIGLVSRCPETNLWMVGWNLIQSPRHANFCHTTPRAAMDTYCELQRDKDPASRAYWQWSLKQPHWEKED